MSDTPSSLNLLAEKKKIGKKYTQRNISGDSLCLYVAFVCSELEKWSTNVNEMARDRNNVETRKAINCKKSARRTQKAPSIYALTNTLRSYKFIFVCMWRKYMAKHTSKPTHTYTQPWQQHTNSIDIPMQQYMDGKCPEFVSLLLFWWTQNTRYTNWCLCLQKLSSFYNIGRFLFHLSRLPIVR